MEKEDEEEVSTSKELVQHLAAAFPGLGAPDSLSLSQSVVRALRSSADLNYGSLRSELARFREQADTLAFIAELGRRLRRPLEDESRRRRREGGRRRKEDEADVAVEGIGEEEISYAIVAFLRKVERRRYALTNPKPCCSKNRAEGRQCYKRINFSLDDILDYLIKRLDEDHGRISENVRTAKEMVAALSEAEIDREAIQAAIERVGNGEQISKLKAQLHLKMRTASSSRRRRGGEWKFSISDLIDYVHDYVKKLCGV